MQYFYKEEAHAFFDATIDINITTNQSKGKYASSTMRMNIENDSMIPHNHHGPSSQFDLPSSSTAYTSPPPMTLPDFQPLFGMPLQAESTFGSFISSVLNNIRDKQLKKRAKLEIQQVIFKYSSQDVSMQMTEQHNNDSGSDE